MRISFDFDEETKKISNLNVESENIKKVVRKKTESNKLILKGNSLKLNNEVLDLLKVKSGERLCIRFNPDPVILTPETANEPNGGNLITKSLTISCKGETSSLLAKHGEEFFYSLKSDGYLVLLDKEPSKEIEGQQEEIHTTTLDDLDFSIPELELGETIIN